MTDWVQVDRKSVTFPYVIKPAYVAPDYVAEYYVAGEYISYDVGDPLNVYTTQDKATNTWL